MGDEYGEEGSGDACGGDRKYPVSQLSAIRGHGERTNGEPQESSGESPPCIETAVVTKGKLSNEGCVNDSYRQRREARGMSPNRLIDWAKCSDREKNFAW